MNQLGTEKSPYLLQHAGNPVHWRAWNEAALAEARRTGKPILLSIGYAACHWCHVMAHESFEDADTAAVMNAEFVNIKVDREERPDIDHIHMTALHALGEQGGWPLTMFLTPDGAPFWGGTYFPPEPRWGRPSFRQVLEAVARTWRDREDPAIRNPAVIGRALAHANASAPGRELAPGVVRQVGQALLRLVDPVEGGLRGAPKFPNAPIFRLFWQLGTAPEGASEYREAVHHLLHAMSQGGIYDHLGGGYARYSTDAEWLAPHFEKMLYDNAQLLELLALAYADRPDPLYAERATETVGWLLREMRSEGAFAAALDADSEGEEGKFYVWTREEVEAALGSAAEEFARAYDVHPAGNWEGHTILRRVVPRGDAAVEARLAEARAALLRYRAGRVPPGRDDKILADWNGLAVAALARAAAIFARPDWLREAAAVWDRLLALLGQPDGRLAHAWRAGAVTAAGLLDDQAASAAAALTLFEQTGAPAYLDAASRIAKAALARFADPDGSFYTSADDARDVPSPRPRTASDGPSPNAQGLMTSNFARLYFATGDETWREHADRLIRAYAGAGNQLTAMPTLLAAAQFLAEGAVCVVVGEAEAARPLLAVARAAPDPALVILAIPEASALPALHPAHGKCPPHGAGAAAFLCRGAVCGLPVTDPSALRAALRRYEEPDRFAPASAAG